MGVAEQIPLCEITEIYSHAFWQKFREINNFTKEISKELI